MAQNRDVETAQGHGGVNRTKGGDSAQGQNGDRVSAGTPRTEWGCGDKLGSWELQWSIGTLGTEWWHNIQKGIVD